MVSVRRSAHDGVRVTGYYEYSIDDEPPHEPSHAIHIAEICHAHSHPLIVCRIEYNCILPSSQLYHAYDLAGFEIHASLTAM